MYSSYFPSISYDSVVIIFQVLMLVQATLSAQYSIFPKGIPPLCVCVCFYFNKSTLLTLIMIEYRKKYFSSGILSSISNMARKAHSIVNETFQSGEML